MEGLRTGIAILLLLASVSLAGAALGWHIRHQAVMREVPAQPVGRGSEDQLPPVETVMAPPGGIESIDTSPVNR